MDTIIRESDLFEIDGTIDRLIAELEGLGAAYSDIVSSIKSGASQVEASLKNVSGATKAGQDAILRNASAVDGYEKALTVLATSLTEVGRQTAWVKAATKDANQATVDQKRQLQEAATSYNKLKLEIKELGSFYKSLTKAEREETGFGVELASQIREKVTQLKEIEASINPVVTQMSALEKAEQRLAYFQSEEGQKLIEVNRQIRELTSSRKEQKTEVDKLTIAQQKLAYAQSDENKALKAITEQTKYANKEKQLEARVTVTAEHSYNRLAAQYDLAVFKLRNMSSATEQGRAEIEQQMQSVKQMRAEMARFNESIGIYNFNVGNYKSTWSGLGYSVQQIVREMPSLAVSWNTFFLAISNNIPILVDEINRLQLANKAALANGGKVVPIGKQIVKALFSWQTALIAIITAMTFFGGSLVKWVQQIFTANNAVAIFRRSLKAIRKEIATTNDSYGNNIVTLKKLGKEYKTLRSDVEKRKWIKDHESDWSKLNVAMNGVAEADELFISNTKAVAEAFSLRARAAAAYKLSEDKYTEIVQQEEKRRQVEEKGVGAYKTRTIMYGSPQFGGYYGQGNTITAQQQYDNEIKNIDKTIERLKTEAEAFFNVGNAADAAAKKILGEYNKDSLKPKSGRDITRYIEQTAVKVEEKYNDAVAKIQQDSFEKRRKEAIKYYKKTTGDLKNTYAENKRILEGYYDDKLQEPLTADQRTALESIQKQIKETLDLNLDAHNKILQDIEYEHYAKLLESRKEFVRLSLGSLEDSAQSEEELMLQSIDIELEAALAANKRLEKELQQSETTIIDYYNRLKQYTKGDYALASFRTEQTTEQAGITQAITAGGARGARTAVRHGAEGSRKREVYNIDKDIALVNKQIQLYYAGQLKLSEEELAQLKLQLITLEAQRKKISDFNGVISDIASGGIAGGILGALGFDENAISAFNQAVDTVISNLNDIAQAEIDVAQAAVEAAEERVSAAQSAYEAELEARNNGYANNVETARKELEEEKRNQEKKQKMLEEAQRRQEAINTITQASSLITAAAMLWSSMSGIPIVGPALAIAAIAAMFGSFAVAKIKAAQVTSSATYGEGGIEFLEGGSHISGNDIDLHTKNSKGKNMRAEGGEALAIINKRNTKKYKKVLPDIVHSLNDGTFQDKFSNAFNAEFIGSTLLSTPGLSVDLNTIESELREIRRQNEKNAIVLADGTIIVQSKNKRRIIKI